MAKRTQHTIGLDIGTSKVTCIAGEPGEGGFLEVVGIGEAEARGLRKGVIVNPDAAVDAIDRIADIDRAACRAAVSARFTVQRMADRYLDLYRSLLD